MADYYSILKKTVSGLPDNTAENRSLVYEKARATVNRQLRSLDPPPSDSAISAQLAALDAAVDQIEDEFAEPAMTAGAAGQPAFSEPPMPEPPSPAPPSRHGPAGPAMAPDPPPGSAGFGQSAGAMDFDERHSPHYESDLGGGERLQADVFEDEPRRSGRMATILAILVVLGLLGGGGYAMWQNREPLMAMLGLDQMQMADSGEQQAAGNDGTGADTDASGKEEVRLGADGETIDASDSGSDDAQDGSETISSDDGSDVRVVDSGSDDVEVNPVGDDDSQSDVAADDTGAAAGEGQDEEEVPVPAIGQKAFLYEEGLGNIPAKRDNAVIVWSSEQEPPAEGFPPETVIKGLLEVPGRGLTMDLTIRRNVDESLSASHIIELVFNVPSDFTGGDIDTLARFVMKASEQARGEPLVAVPVKIDTGYFMIALNNLQQARQSNKQLLLDSSWIDIPLGYTTGRRALVTLEKGAVGNRIFREAFEDWENR